MEEELIVQLALATKESIRVKVAPLLERIEKLEKVAAENERLKERLASLEKNQRGLKYCGTFESGRRYELGDCVTHDGSLWHCNLPTSARPDGGDQWSLAVKRGRDAAR